MKRVVEYKMHGNEIPYFIENGGHFPNDGKLIGVTKDDHDCYIPLAGLLVLESKEELASYVEGSLDLVDVKGVALSSEQKIELANSWWDQNA